MSQQRCSNRIFQTIPHGWNVAATLLQLLHRLFNDVATLHALTDVVLAGREFWTTDSICARKKFFISLPSLLIFLRSELDIFDRTKTKQAEWQDSDKQYAT